MATVDLGEPPAGGSTYKDYKPWLLDGFFDHICAYCLLFDPHAEIDHYEPREYAPHRVNDPTNLLLACRRCNGGGGKGDYHPRFERRRCRPRDTTGHMVLDVRVDDFATLVALDTKGEIAPMSGPHRDRTSWNITLLKLDLPASIACRKELQDLKAACEEAVAWLYGDVDDVARAKAREILRRLLPALARRALFFVVHGITLSERLQAEVARVLTELKASEHAVR